MGTDQKSRFALLCMMGALCLVPLIFFLYLSSMIDETTIINSKIAVINIHGRIQEFFLSKVHNLFIDMETLIESYNIQTEETYLYPDVKNFSFVHLGHTRGYRGYIVSGKNFDRISVLINKLQPDFILHSGDLIANPSDLNDWKTQFFEIFKDIQIPIYISPSNHERRDDYKNYQLLIRDELWYSFDVGDYHFVVVAYMETSEEQINWFIREIENNDNIIVLLGGQQNTIFQKLVEGLKPSSIKLILGGDGQPYSDNLIGDIPYLVSNEFFIREININNDKISWRTYSLEE